MGNIIFGEPLRKPEKLSVEVGPGDGENTPVYRSEAAKEKLFEIYDERIRSQWDLFEVSSSAHADNDFLGVRENGGKFVWKKYKDVNQEVKWFASGLEHLGLLKDDTTKKLKLMGLCGTNAPQWLIAEFATFALGGTTVPFYHTYNSDQFEYGLTLTGCATMLCQNAVADTVLEAKKKGASALEILISYDPMTYEDKGRFESAGIKILSFDEVLQIGKDHPMQKFPGSKPDDVMTFVWTSGTTGHPKGVLITQKAMMANITAFRTQFDTVPETKISEDDYYLSYLPLAHAMERAIFSVLISYGAHIGFFQGERTLIMSDLKELEPTIFVSVPRLLNKIYDSITTKVNAQGGVKARLFNKALADKIENLHQGYLHHALWDRLVFKKVKEMLGLSRVRWIATGSAPIASHVLDFLRAVFACPVTEGYGQSEVTCLATGTHPYDFTAGHVGYPANCCEIKLQSVPDMKYLVSDTHHGKEGKEMKCKGRGEVCIRGASTLLEYYRREDATALTLDKDGFVHTGDIGLITPTNELKIIDRKNNLFKLAQGEYVAPEKCENVISRAPIVAQALVHGDSLKTFTVAIVCPDPEVLIPWAKEMGWVATDVDVMDQSAMQMLCEKQQVLDRVMQEINDECHKAKVFSFEIPKRVHLSPEPFSVENSILTPTFKLKRNVAREVFRDILEKLYE